jgi:UDP-2-acetamido-2,6-beta-L-arabino-hexul-4-ose reductase
LARIGITGSDGFLGWHLRAFLHASPDVAVVAADRHAFADAQKLRDFVRAADAIVHLAGVNRGDDRAMRDTNIQLAERLIEACTSTGTTPHVVFANSTHFTRASAYGESKRIAAEKFSEWADKARATFTNLVIPHAFGERGRPHYNSAIATFCHQLAHDEVPKIIQDGELELIHAQRIAEEIMAVIARAQGGEVRLRGTPIRVSAALSTLQRMARQYDTQVIPALESSLELDLFNTYRWHLFPKHYPVDLGLRRDERGDMFDAIKTLHGGQCMLSTTKPAITRGNHYHRRKLERFLVLQGEALMRVRRLLTDDITEFRVSGARPQFVDMPTLHTHNITNVGAGDLTTLFWTQEIFDADSPDTYPEKV